MLGMCGDVCGDVSGDVEMPSRCGDDMDWCSAALLMYGSQEKMEKARQFQVEANLRLKERLKELQTYLKKNKHKTYGANCTFHTLQILFSQWSTNIYHKYTPCTPHAHHMHTH